MILKSQQIFRGKKHNLFTEEINKTALNANDDKRIQSIDSVETYSHGSIKEIEKKEIKCYNVIIKRLTIIILQKKII